MKSKRFSVEQIVSALKQHDAGLPLADIARKLGIAEGTFYAWKKKYAGLSCINQKNKRTCLLQRSAALRR